VTGAPGKLAAVLLLAIGFGGLLAWFVMPMLSRDQPSTLSRFLDTLHESARRLEPDGRVAVPLPTLRAGEQIVLAMGANATALAKDVDVSQRARAAIESDLAIDGPPITFFYLVFKGEVRERIPVSRCNLEIADGDARVVTPASKQAASLECAPVGVEPGECRDIIGLWNERCASRLVLR
jgi:hypothetical protein